MKAHFLSPSSAAFVITFLNDYYFDYFIIALVSISLMASEVEHLFVSLFLNSTHHGFIANSSVLMLKIMFSSLFGWMNDCNAGWLPGKGISASWSRYWVSQAAGNPCIATYCSQRKNCSDGGDALIECKTKSWTSFFTKHLRKTFFSGPWKIFVRVKGIQENLAIFLLTQKYGCKFRRSSCVMGTNNLSRWHGLRLCPSWLQSGL